MTLPVGSNGQSFDETVAVVVLVEHDTHDLPVVVQDKHLTIGAYRIGKPLAPDEALNVGLERPLRSGAFESIEFLPVFRREPGGTSALDTHRRFAVGPAPSGSGLSDGLAGLSGERRTRRRGCRRRLEGLAQGGDDPVDG